MIVASASRAPSMCSSGWPVADDVRRTGGRRVAQDDRVFARRLHEPDGVAAGVQITEDVRRREPVGPRRAGQLDRVAHHAARTPAAPCRPSRRRRRRPSSRPSPRDRPSTPGRRCGVDSRSTSVAGPLGVVSAEAGAAGNGGGGGDRRDDADLSSWRAQASRALTESDRIKPSRVFRRTARAASSWRTCRPRSSGPRR